MNPRRSVPQTPMSNRSTRNNRHAAHSLLEAELRDIRQSLWRLERELSNNIVEMPAKQDNSKAA